MAIGFDFLKSVTQEFEGSSDVGKAVLLHIEFLLQRARVPLAKKMIEDIIAGLCPTSLDTTSQSLGEHLPAEKKTGHSSVSWQGLMPTGVVQSWFKSEPRESAVINSNNASIKVFTWKGFLLANIFDFSGPQFCV